MGIVDLVSRWWQQARNWWSSPAPIEQPQIEPAQKIARKPRDDSRSKDIEETGRWYFRRDILDRLQDYMKYISYMRTHDPQSYALYSKVGAVIVSGKALFNGNRSDTVPLAKGLSFGAVALLDENEEDALGAKFIYFQKLRRCRDINRFWLVAGDVYRVTIFWSDDQKKGMKGIPGECYVRVGKDGNVTPLRQQLAIKQALPPSRKRDGSGFRGGASLHHYEWDFPRFLKEGGHPPKPRDPMEAGRSIFLMAYNGYANASMDVRIACTKGGDTAAFSVDLLRMPYFFADRDATALTPTGQRKRIFHIVRTHLRNGRSVRSHFRGVRSFTWCGYKVLITMPGKHHNDLLDADFDGHDYHEGEKSPAGWIPMAEMGKIIQRHVSH